MSIFLFFYKKNYWSKIIKHINKLAIMIKCVLNI